MKTHPNTVEKNKSQRGIRLANYMIDRIVIYVFFFLFGSFAFLMYEFLDIGFFLNITDWLAGMSRLEDIAITSLFYFLYVFLMEYFTKGRTLGKLITGTKVIHIHGNEPSLQDYFIRNASRIVPFDALSFLGENGWHDSWSNTRVVNMKNYDAQSRTKNEIETLGTKEVA